MGQYLDGRVTAVIGTHTHVQTSDARVLPGGTAYITDVGMTGPRDSVIGVSTEVILRRFTTELPQQFEVADGPVRLDAVLIGSDGGRATGIEADGHRSRRPHPVGWQSAQGPPGAGVGDHRPTFRAAAFRVGPSCGRLGRGSFLWTGEAGP